MDRTVQSRNHKLDQEWARTPIARSQEISQPFYLPRRGGSHAPRPRHTDPIQCRITEVENIERGAAGIGADLGQLEFQNRIFAVREYYRGDIEPLARLRP